MNQLQVINFGTAFLLQGSDLGARGTNPFTGSLTPNLPDVIGGPAAAGVLDDSVGFAEKPELDTLRASAPCIDVGVAQIDSVYLGYHQVFLTNTSGDTLYGVTLTISRLGTIAIGDLPTHQSFSTLVPVGAGNDPSVTIGWVGFSQSFDTEALGTAYIVGLGLHTSPVVVHDPESAVGCAGSSVSFQVSAAGAAQLHYQWRKDGLPLTDDGRITGAVTAQLGIDAVTPADVGSYDVVASSACGVVTSASAQFTIASPPEITLQPAPLAACTGELAHFEVGAVGSMPLSYQWRKDTHPIPGATAAILDIFPVQIGDSGNYDVVVSDACVSVMSEAVTLMVKSPAHVVTDPDSRSISVGRTVTLSVTASGTGPLTYHWRKGGQPLTDGGRISGATSPTLTISATWMSDSGSYDVVVTNDCGSVTSAPATLTVTGCRGDLNCDGRVTFADIDAFVLALSSWGGYLQRYPNCDIMFADINGDGYVTFADIDPFVAVIGTTCP